MYNDDIARLKKITVTMNKGSHRHICETTAILAPAEAVFIDK